MPILAIIVPVYNVERYLHECIDRIIEQTFTDFELLLVDDGSTDKSGFICDQYANRDSRIRVFHKTNGGVSSARNMALDNLGNAGFKWLTFIDADDFISVDFIEKLLKPTFENGDLDFVHGGCTNYWDKESRYSVEQYYAPITSRDKRKLLEGIRGLLHAKLFSAGLVEAVGLRFDEKVRIAEDLIFSIEYIRYVNKYAFCEERGYFYRRHASSTTQSVKCDYDSALACFKHFYKAVKDYKTEYSITDSKVRDEQLARYIMETVFALYRNAYPRRERLYRLRVDFCDQELLLLKKGIPNKSKNALAKILMTKKYILFDTLVAFLFASKSKMQQVCQKS